MLRNLCILLVGFTMAMFHSNAQVPSKETKPLVIILLGPPGSGKGTQAVELTQYFNLPHISTGDLFRDNIRNQTELGKEAQYYLDKGALVPDSLVFDILFDRISQADCKNGYLLDGFPRTSAQAHELEDTLNGKVNFLVFNLNVPDQEVIRRLEGRLVCKKCGRPFHKESNPPKKAGICDSCGGELYQRSDDTAPVIKERLRVYYEQTKPLEAFYRQKGLLIDIDAAKNSTEVLQELKNTIEKKKQEKTQSA